MKKTNKGFGVLEGLLVVGLIAAGAWVAHKFTRTAGAKEGTPIAAVEKVKADASADSADKEKGISAEDKSQLDTAQAGVHATGEALNQAELKAASGKDVSREISTAKEINKLTQDAIDAGLNQPVDPKLLRWFMGVIEKKNSDIAYERDLGEKMLKMRSDDLQASLDREAKLRQEKIDSDAAWAKKLKEAEDIRDKWSLENDVKAHQLDRIYIVVGGLLAIWVLGIILPIVAKVFPGVAPISSAVSAIVGPSVQWAKSKADNLATDLVSLQEHAKKYIADIDPTQVQEYKDSVSAWWEGDRSSTNEVEAIKSKLRV